MSFTPLHDRVLVRRIKGDETTKGGLIIQILPRRSLKKAKLSASALGEGARTANASRWTSKPATGSCSENGPAQRSNSMAKTF